MPVGKKKRRPNFAVVLSNLACSKGNFFGKIQNMVSFGSELLNLLWISINLEKMF